MVIGFLTVLIPLKAQSDVISIECVTGGSRLFVPIYLIKNNNDSSMISTLYKDSIIPYFGLQYLESFVELDELLMSNQKDSSLLMDENKGETWGGFKITGKTKFGVIKYKFYVCCSEKSIEYFINLKNKILEINKEDHVEIVDICIKFLYEQKRY